MSDEIKEELEEQDIINHEETDMIDEDGVNDELISIIEETTVTDTPISEAEIEKANKIITDNDEIAQFNKEVLGQLESPLIVHKKSDASYEDNASAFEMNETHTEEARPTLKRHRFKKEQKKKNRWVGPLFIIVVICAVFAGIYYSGGINVSKEKTTTFPAETTTETTTSIQEAFQGKILLKGTYIFVDGYEVNGIEGLQNALKYVDPSPTAYEIVKENANADFLNNDILPLMQQMGFYDETTVITNVATSGLMAQEEMTVPPPPVTEAPVEETVTEPVSE